MQCRPRFIKLTAALGSWRSTSAAEVRPDWRAALVRFLEAHMSFNFVYEDGHEPCRLQALGLSARNAVADVIASWAPDGKSLIYDIRQEGTEWLPEVIAHSVDMVILVCFAIGKNVFKKKTVAVPEARLAILGVAPATLAVFRSAADRD